MKLSRRLVASTYSGDFLVSMADAGRLGDFRIDYRHLDGAGQVRLRFVGGVPLNDKTKALAEVTPQLGLKYTETNHWGNVVEFHFEIERKIGIHGDERAQEILRVLLPNLGIISLAGCDIKIQREYEVRVPMGEVRKWVPEGRHWATAVLEERSIAQRTAALTGFLGRTGKSMCFERRGTGSGPSSDGGVGY